MPGIPAGLPGALLDRPFPRPSRPTWSSWAPDPPARPPPRIWPAEDCTWLCWRSRSFPGEGVRRRSDPAGHPTTDPARHRHVEQAGWLHNKGLRIYGGERPFQLEWPDLADFPPYGLVRPRSDFDDLLVRNAASLGGEAVRADNVTSPIMDDRTGRIIGVAAKDGRRFRAPVVVAADGNSTRLSLAMGPPARRPTDGRGGADVLPQPRTAMTTWSPGWSSGTASPGKRPAARIRLDLRDGRRHLQRRARHAQHLVGFRQDRLQGPAQALAGQHPGGVGLPGREHDHQPRGGPADGLQPAAALHDGLLLVGDAGGMVNPFNGEGIAYAMESAEMAADAIAEAHYRGVGTTARSERCRATRPG